MFRLIISCSLLTMLCGAVTAQTKSPTEQPNGAIVVFYNVENLFDTIDSPATDDSEFLPGSKKQWNSARFKQKVKNISKVLESIDSVNLPAIIGLSEIENRSVLNALVSSESLKRGDYRIIHEESIDPRGIDQALIYRSSLFKEISHSLIPVFYGDSSTRPTRELLYVCGVLSGKDTLHIVVNHWKSRSGGTSETEPKRISYARTVRHFTDSIFSIRPSANIVLMGDFNDNPEDSSISKVLKAGDLRNGLSPKCLYNLCLTHRERGEGSLYYDGWNLFDQIIVSTNLLTLHEKKLMAEQEAYFFSRPWMLYRTSKGIMAPSKTYSSDHYYGGYSDHLPVWVRLFTVPAKAE
jgi:predicted extracellular nuclease